MSLGAAPLSSPPTRSLPATPQCVTCCTCDNRMFESAVIQIPEFLHGSPQQGYTHLAYSPATAMGVAFTHQLKNQRVRQLKPVPPETARALIAKVFQAPELRHARRPAPWINPIQNVAYIGSSHALLLEPKQHPQSPTEPVPLCPRAYDSLGGTTHSFTHAPTVRACLPASRAVALPLAEDLAKKTKPQLVEEAKKLHVKHSGKSKGELLAALLERLARRDPPLG